MSWDKIVLTLIVILAIIVGIFLVTGHADLLLCGHHSVNGRTC